MTFLNQLPISVEIALVAFFAQGLCWLLIRSRLRRVGIAVKRVSTTSSYLTEHKLYFHEAPLHGWSRIPVYLSVVFFALFAGLLASTVIPRFH